MPLIQVNMYEGRTAEQKEALLKGIADAVHESLDVPLEAVRVWIYEFGGEEFLSGAALAQERAGSA